jgi:pSer/pThr/pTyr-binding forkhead associated (FHA) protein
VTDNAMDAQATQVEFADAARAVSSGFRLQIVMEPFAGPAQRVSLEVDRELSIGRDPDAGLQLGGHFVSRKHAIVRAVGDGLEVEDPSSHGTLVDGSLLHMNRRRVGRECVLTVGCVRLSLYR